MPPPEPYENCRAAVLSCEWAEMNVVLQEREGWADSFPGIKEETEAPPLTFGSKCLVR